MNIMNYQDRVLNSPMPNPMLMMVTSPALGAQTTAATSKQVCSHEGFSDRKMFNSMACGFDDSRSPNAVRNFGDHDLVMLSTHKQYILTNHGPYPIDLINQHPVEASNPLAHPAETPDFVPLSAEGHHLQFSANKGEFK